MSHPLSSKDRFFTLFDESIETYSLPERFTYPFEYEPHALSLLASRKLQRHLEGQSEWEHNFGLGYGEEGKVIGKMFGVLVVRDQQHQIGYLAGFSGKLANSYHHPGFVPPVFDSLQEGSFLNNGMRELTRINQEIKRLEELDTADCLERIHALQTLRRTNSIALQGKLFDQYRFLNQVGEEKSLREVFQKESNNNPPAGAGDCAAPKLLQYAFQHRMQPLALAEFWWGLSPKSDYWQHGQFYPACREKCAPILSHMLQGMVLDEKPNPNRQSPVNKS